MRLATTGKKAADEEQIKITNSADIRAPSWPLYSLLETPRAQITSRGSAVVRSTLLALNAGVPKSLVDMLVGLWGADWIDFSCFRWTRKQ